MKTPFLKPHFSVALVGLAVFALVGITGVGAEPEADKAQADPEPDKAQVDPLARAAEPTSRARGQI